MSDFGFYGDSSDDTIVEDIQGITDGITSYSYTGVEYPCLVLRDGFSCPKHRMEVIAKMVRTSGDDKDISLYFNNSGETYKLGNISGKQVKAFLDIVGTDNVIGFLSKDTAISNDMLYVLYSID